MEECRFKPENVGAQIKDYVTIAEGDEEEMKTVVGTIGPVSVIITVDFTFMVYQKGVYYKEDCVNTKEPYNHAVTVVGYGTEDGQDYWLVKNEWGLTFGDQGYIKMARNRENNCGIATVSTDGRTGVIWATTTVFKSEKPSSHNRVQYRDAFKSFQEKHHKIYKNEKEENYRKQIFLKNLKTSLMKNDDCMNTDEIFNHAAVVVGYGTEDGEDYWAAAVAAAFKAEGDFSDYSDGVYYNPDCDSNKFTHAMLI
ncbi:hypothetical protein GEV33_001406 [Tenebrio molitor]|uniref:Peptidase C1A papain C-terminal domain-containing protein n=1 Tax=Tenebrio molitor TaxID=7067 RepID=A0A8J6HV98_TENMO|nr:hypothetical protein GEV33_001406 [Tenebrio molitor]